MDGCNEICGTMNHFHGQADVSIVFSIENVKGTTSFDAESSVPVIPMCSKGHECQPMCDEKGICRVDVFLKQSLKTFKGVHVSFQ
ncbi:hypothetical protein CCR75_002383 [Bremia lactucae]|uniref:Uncharacterized protein n=1 Tax=Bremia lactucae TaxID=4779 RepID=A0A976FMP8_BRELC|nr:hypothetical protein CCR75_002383 [Bremia lactucae]